MTMTMTMTMPSIAIWNDGGERHSFPSSPAKAPQAAPKRARHCAGVHN
jgi:hypothetical protein